VGRKKNWNFGATTTGAFIMTMHIDEWRITVLARTSSNLTDHLPD
jgi:hypothetical protein